MRIVGHLCRLAPAGARTIAAAPELLAHREEQTALGLSEAQCAHREGALGSCLGLRVPNDVVRSGVVDARLDAKIADEQEDTLHPGDLVLVDLCVTGGLAGRSPAGEDESVLPSASAGGLHEDGDAYGAIHVEVGAASGDEDLLVNLLARGVFGYVDLLQGCQTEAIGELRPRGLGDLRVHHRVEVLLPHVGGRVQTQDLRRGPPRATVHPIPIGSVELALV
mmetsp:Transcript_6155/g.19716  ORF Transcript_6155/g.19716 Transcript_6155/m.19716 type:complete len:222 (+) Transcript_6155:1141-1806(+)